MNNDQNNQNDFQQDKNQGDQNMNSSAQYVHQDNQNLGEPEQKANYAEYQQPKQAQQTQQANQVYQQPNQGYNQANQNYQQPNQGYQQPNQGYQQPNQGYQQPNQGYQQPNQGYQQPNQGYQQPNQGYQQRNQGYNYQQYPGGHGFQKGPIGEIRSPVTVLLLSIVTCGIYGIIWFYKVSEEINEYTRQELTSPTFAIVGILCFIFTYINAYKVDEALFIIDSAEGRHPEKRFLLWILLSFIVGIGTFMMIYQVQESLNRIWSSNMPAGYRPQ